MNRPFLQTPGRVCKNNMLYHVVVIFCQIIIYDSNIYSKILSLRTEPCVLRTVSYSFSLISFKVLAYAANTSSLASCPMIFVWSS